VPAFDDLIFTLPEVVAVPSPEFKFIEPPRERAP
jgi:hypothetical protein